jgi:predicted acyltransferase
MATASPPSPTTARPERLASLDAYRGLIMLMMGAAGFGFGAVANGLAEQGIHSSFWEAAKYQTGHVPWVGCAVWDLIQPAFMFMVGVAVPYSYSRREQEGQSRAAMFGHALQRAVVLIVLSIFLMSVFGCRQTNFTFTTVLTQIGLGYVFVVLLRNRSLWLQSAAVVAILAGYWALFYFYPSPQPEDFNVAGYKFPERCAPEDWPLLSGVAAHWNVHENFAGWFDRWFLNLFPREKTFEFEPGGYQTLNFIPSVATMLLGLMAGELLRSGRRPWAKVGILAAAGGVLIIGGLAAGWTICPIVKRIWTPSWVLFSGGIVVWLLAAFYAIIDVLKWRWWVFPFVVVGMNSITMYVMVHLLRGWTWSMLNVHFGLLMNSGPVQAFLRLLYGPDGFNPVYMPIVESLAVLFAFWLVCWWMYRQKIFVRI